MKHLLLTALLVLGANMVSAQNSLTVQNKTAAGTVGTVLATFTDHSTVSYVVGGPGKYTFEIGSKEVETLTFGTVVCAVGKTETIPMSSGGTAEQRLERVQDESRGFNSIIR